MTDQQLAILEIKEHLRDIKKDLSYHIKRCDLLEEALADISNRIKPLETSDAMWAGAFKAVMVLGAIGAVAKVVYELFLK